MSDSPILGVPDIGETQNNKYITHNNAIRFLEQAANSMLSKTISGTTAVTLTNTECWRYSYYVAVDGTSSGAFNFIFLGEPNGVDNAHRTFLFKNATANIATVKSDAAGTTVVVKAGASCIIHQEHDDMVKLAEFNGLLTAPYDIGLFIPGLPDDGAEVFKFVAVRAIDFVDNFVGSVGHVGTNPAATASFDVKKNGSSIGSVSISTGGVFTFNTTGAGTALAIGDRLSLVSPSPQDTNLANVAMSFLGTRTL